MNDPRPGTMHAVLDAYRADATERETLLRSIEKRNRVLEAESALLHRELLVVREGSDLIYALGGFAGASILGCSGAIDRGDREAAIVWGTLAVVFIGARWILRVFGRGKRS